MGTPALLNAIPCPKCGAEVGAPCINLNTGGAVSRSHVLRTPPAPCGTHGGYQRHKKAGEPACESCRDAHRRYMAEHRRRNPEYRQRDIDLLRVRREATRLLIKRHRAEFDALMKSVGAA